MVDCQIMSVTAVVTIIFSILTDLAEAGEFCDNGNYCAGWSYCCGFGMCCETRVYNLWWFWTVWVVIFLMIVSCGVCCRRRYVARRESGVVVTTGQPVVYGTVPQYPAQPYNYNPQSAAATGYPKPPPYAPPQPYPGNPPPGYAP
ncbi:uncharacterized protein LOC141903726 [Tubulanus polymorphus]|uniref:uncharacterized protein LOC141903726 n=1 Tax=Tubulanus polymorphus TaxID=672921 RepID=UPI003DA602A7